MSFLKEVVDFLDDAIEDHGVSRVHAVVVCELCWREIYHAPSNYRGRQYISSSRGDHVPMICNQKIYDLQAYEVAIMSDKGGLLCRRVMSKGQPAMSRRNNKWRTLRYGEAKVGMRVRATGGIAQVGQSGKIIKAMGDQATVMYRDGATYTFYVDRLQVNTDTLKADPEEKQESLIELIQNAAKQYTKDTNQSPKYGYLDQNGFVRIVGEVDGFKRKDKDYKEIIVNTKTFKARIPTPSGIVSLYSSANVPVPSKTILFAKQDLSEVPVGDWDVQKFAFRKYVLDKVIGSVTVEEATSQLSLLRESVNKRSKNAPWNI